jgi:hypothetical protein
VPYINLSVLLVDHYDKTFAIGFGIGLLIFIAISLISAHLSSDCGLLAVFGRDSPWPRQGRCAPTILPTLAGRCNSMRREALRIEVTSTFYFCSSILLLELFSPSLLAGYIRTANRLCPNKMFVL